MERRPKRGVDGERGDHAAAEPLRCLVCESDDGVVKAGHHLRLAREGLDALRDHLRQYHAIGLPADRGQESIASICAWIAGEMSTWSGMADQETGRAVPWWEARASTSCTANALPD